MDTISTISAHKSFDQWLKQEFGLKSKQEGLSDQDKLVCGTSVTVKLDEPTIKYIFDTADNLTKFSQKFGITLKTGYKQDLPPLLPSLYINDSDLNKIKAEYKKAYPQSPSLDDLQKQIDLLEKLSSDHERGSLKKQNTKDKVNEAHGLATGKKHGSYVHRTIVAYKTYIDCYLAFEYQNLSQAERDEITERSKWLFNDSHGFTALKGDANLIACFGRDGSVVAKQPVLIYQATKDVALIAKITTHATNDADCLLKGVGRKSAKKKATPGYNDSFSNILVDESAPKWKVVPRFFKYTEDGDYNSGTEAILPETNTIRIEGGGIGTHSFTAEYWWKATTQDNSEVKTKYINDSNLVLGKNTYTSRGGTERTKEVKGLDIMLWKLPGKNYWIRPKDYGNKAEANNFIKVDENGAEIENGIVPQEDLNTLKTLKYSYYRTVYNGGSQADGFNKALKEIDAIVTHQIDPLDQTHGGTNDQLMFNSLRTKMIAERMVIATYGNDTQHVADYAKWRTNFTMNVSNRTFRRLPSQIGGNCTELNKFYCLLGREESSIDTILQEMRANFVKCNNADQILQKIEEKKASLIEEKKRVEKKQKEDAERNRKEEEKKRVKEKQKENAERKRKEEEKKLAEKKQKVEKKQKEDAERNRKEEEEKRVEEKQKEKEDEERKRKEKPSPSPSTDLDKTKPLKIEVITLEIDQIILGNKSKDAKDTELAAKIEESLATQKANHNPTSAYRGIGVGSEVKKFGDKVMIEIQEIYAPEKISRFKGRNDPNDKPLVGGKIVAVFDNAKGEWVDINEIFSGDENNAKGLRRMAELFHDTGTINFRTISHSKDGTETTKEYACDRDINSVFITNNCPEAKDHLKAKNPKITGDSYSAKRYGITTLKGLNENLSASITK